MGLYKRFDVPDEELVMKRRSDKFLMVRVTQERDGAARALEIDIARWEYGVTLDDALEALEEEAPQIEMDFQ